MFGLPELTINAWLRFDGIRRGLRAARPGTVLEIGAGEGGLGAWLASRYEYVGIEQDDLSRATAQARLDRVGRGRLFRQLDDCGDTQFDLVCAFEVLEHVPDDVKVLLRWREHMHSDGHLLLSVPAHSRRYGPFDELAGHYRRYDRSVIVQRLADGGFELMRLTSHGTGLGTALEHGRNLFARRARRSGTPEERTTASGRTLQPHGDIAMLACATIAAPLRALQAPLAGRDGGTGYVVFARRLH